MCIIKEIKIRFCWQTTDMLLETIMPNETLLIKVIESAYISKIDLQPEFSRTLK